MALVVGIWGVHCHLIMGSHLCILCNFFCGVLRLYGARVMMCLRVVVEAVGHVAELLCKEAGEFLKKQGNRDERPSFERLR